MATSQAAKGGLGALLKRGWNEIPDIIAGTGHALIGVAVGVVGLIGYYRMDGDNRRYKEDIVVFRDTDPRAKLTYRYKQQNQNEEN